MDLKPYEWKPQMLDRMEKILDSELKYTDAKKGIECRSIDFEQEAGYPKQDARFMDLSIRGLCTDERGRVHNIEKQLMIVAFERHVHELNAVIAATIYRIDDVQFYKRNRNLLNLIIIPVSVGLTLLLIGITFFLRRLRYAQKRRHIVDALQKKKQATDQKGKTIANVDPNASERERLLQLDPTVVGSPSNTIGSPKDFTKEQSFNPSRNTNNNSNNRNDQSGTPPPVPSKENRPPYTTTQRNDDNSFQNQRSLRSSRERVNVPYENQPRFSPTQYNPEYSNMIPTQEQQPRVVVRTVRGDDDNEQRSEPFGSFVPIPVQIERSGPQQRHVSPPYHSDPYYRHTNA